MLELSRICVVSAGEFEGLTVYKELPTEGDWDVCVFADAGCTVEDILRCAQNTLQTDRATLGIRKNTGFWNKLTRLLYKFFAGLKLADTEPSVIALPKAPDKHRHKAQLLLDIKKQALDFDELSVTETPQSSFFKVILTWFLILGHFIKYGLSAVFSALLEEGLLALFGRLFLGLFTGFAFTAVTAGLAWIVSSVVNFFMNQKLVFESKGKTVPAMLRYYALALPNALIRILLAHGLYVLLGIAEGQTLLRGVLHFCVMVVLFCITFVIQQRWVFKKDC